MLTRLQQMTSPYIQVLMLWIGLYMFGIQKKYLLTVNHLEKEATFVKWVGLFYLVLTGVSIVFKLFT